MTDRTRDVAISSLAAIVVIVVLLAALGVFDSEGDNLATVSTHSTIGSATTDVTVTLRGDRTKHEVGNALRRILKDAKQSRASNREIKLDKLEYDRTVKLDAQASDFARGIWFWPNGPVNQMPKCSFGEQWVNGPVSPQCGPHVLVVRKGGPTMRDIARRLGNAKWWRELCYYSPRGVALFFGNYNPWRLKPGRYAGGCT